MVFPQCTSLRISPRAVFAYLSMYVITCGPPGGGAHRLMKVNGLAHAIASFEEEKKDFTSCAAKVPAYIAPVP